MPHLTITALSITSERLSAAEGEAFHLTIHVHAKQHGADLASLILPDLTNLTILGDEKRTSPERSGGTDYQEILTVAGVKPGEATVSPAYIDADDPSRGDRPFRFSSNSLRLRITPMPGHTPAWETTARNALRTAGFAALGVVVFGILGFIMVRIGRIARRKERYVTLPRPRPVPAARATATIDRDAEIRIATERLERERSRDAAAALRTTLFAFAGARSDETLTSLLERIPSDQRALRGALRAAERATFVDEPHLQGAVEDLLDAVRHVVTA